MKKILLLGGTAEARQQLPVFIQLLETSEYSLVYSLAGLVRLPKDHPCELIFGGFSQYGGLAAYIEQENIVAIIDMTHPYAEKMSHTAWLVSQQLAIHYWQYQRPEWQPGLDDNWRVFNDRAALFSQLENQQSVFLALGQLQEQELGILHSYRQQGQKQYLRVAKEPSYTLDGLELIIDIGPFDIEQELHLLSDLRVDCLVCKNSGGASSFAKIIAARQLSLPVFMLARPEQRNTNIHDDLNAMIQNIQVTLTQ